MIQVKDGNLQLNTGKVVVGYDLGNEYSQISYFRKGDDEPHTVSLFTGTEQYNIPTVIAKRPGVGQWFYGKEAQKYAKEGCFEVNDLLKKAEVGEEVLVENDLYDPVALLTLFVKRSLSLLNMEVSSKEIEAFMFTVSDLSPRIVEVLGKVVAGLNLKCSVYTYQSHVESFYSYMIHQDSKLWERDVLCFEFVNSMKMWHMSKTTNTKPTVVLIRQEEYSSFVRKDFPEDEALCEKIKQETDSEFESLCRDALTDIDVSTVYLLGDGFKDDWAKDSLKVLCKNRRVFQGNNLYSKGACYALLEKIAPSDLSKNFVYLGDDKIKSNVGMKALRRGEDSYFAIIDAGENWYEVKADFDMILDDGNEFSFVVTSLTGGNVIEKPIVLDGLPKRPRGTTRLGFHIEMSSVNRLQLEITDKGFGEIIKSSGRAWNQSIVI